MGYEQSLAVLLNQLALLTRKLVGNAGCDFLPSAATYEARLGKITSAIVNEDSTGITSIVELDKGVESTVTSRSYLATNTLKQGSLIVFEKPVKTITVATGSLWVYYTDL
jgi:hypothetical protein